MKNCISCTQLLPRSSFYVHPQMRDGTLNKCKSCCKRDAIKNRNLKIERYRELDRLRANQPDRVAARQKYAKTKRGAAITAAAKLRWSQLNSHKRRAHLTVSRAIASGKLKRKPCAVCKTKRDVEAHHDDYTQPLRVQFLCGEHHRQRHRELRQILRRSQTF